MITETYKDKLIRGLQTLTLNGFNIKQNHPRNTAVKQDGHIKIWLKQFRLFWNIARSYLKIIFQVYNSLPGVYNDRDYKTFNKRNKSIYLQQWSSG